MKYVMVVYGLLTAPNPASSAIIVTPITAILLIENVMLNSPVN